MNDDFWVKKLGLMKMCDLSLSLKADERIAFVADVHLSSTNENKNLFFTKFLQTLDSSVKALFIVGDLFNYYVGTPQAEDEIYSSVFAETRKLHAVGTKIFFIPGNRDFFAFKELQQFGIVTLPTWVLLKVETEGEIKKILLTHGDSFMTTKHDFRFYSKVIRSGIVYQMFNTIPYKIRIRIAKFMRGTLGAKYRPLFKLEEIVTDYEYIKKDYINAFEYPLKSGIADVLIHGHWHLRANIAVNPGKIFVIGDWREDVGAYVEFGNGEFNHEIFVDKN